MLLSDVFPGFLEGELTDCVKGFGVIISDIPGSSEIFDDLSQACGVLVGGPTGDYLNGMRSGVLYDLAGEACCFWKERLPFRLEKCVSLGLQHRLDTNTDVADVLFVEGFQLFDLPGVGFRVEHEEPRLPEGFLTHRFFAPFDFSFRQWQYG